MDSGIRLTFNPFSWEWQNWMEVNWKIYPRKDLKDVLQPLQKVIVSNKTNLDQRIGLKDKAIDPVTRIKLEIVYYSF